METFFSKIFMILQTFKIWPTQGLSNWDLSKSIFLAGFARQGVLNRDPTVWLDYTMMILGLIIDICFLGTFSTLTSENKALALYSIDTPSFIRLKALF
jgi:hypothetical protein